MAKHPRTGTRAAKNPAPSPETNLRTASAPRRILIIEDDGDMRALMRRWLERGGHVVDEAISGPAGLSAALHGAHDVAFIDIVLPVLDGYEIARSIRASPVSGRILLVALTATTDDPAVAFEAGFDAHIFKPVEAKTIEAVLEEAARRKGQVR